MATTTHNGAFQCMSRMCSKPSWGDMNICYPTRVGHPGTVLEGRFYNNYCDHGQSMCSPWTPPAISFPVFVGDLSIDFEVAARGCASSRGEDVLLPVVDGCANCEGVPFSGYPFKDGFCSDGPLTNPDLTSYVSNSYIFSSGSTELDIPPACQCLWCPPNPLVALMREIMMMRKISSLTLS